jgi:hypothetical protein
MEGRYISSHEACWRVLGFETNGISHNIVRLPVHLPNQQYVTFHAARPIETVMKKPCSLNFQSQFGRSTVNTKWCCHKVPSHIVSFQNIMHGIKGQKLG